MIKPRAVAYCRVSTNKDEQLDSLESQQGFFLEYAKRQNYNLVHIYADEGKSGTRIKHRIQLQKLLLDARENKFDLVLIKDVSRLARNTVDFLTSIRKLKSYDIKVVFVNYDQTSSDSSEFMLTMLSAIAQEESANTSKRVKFGKRQNAEKGRVPNLCFGYEKINGDYFNLEINLKEAEVVRRIFHMYVEENLGTNRIAKELNQDGVMTKRNCNWSQTAVSRILTNEIYTGKVINGKEEVSDFLTGTRRMVEEEKWMVVYRPELKIISEDIFKKANHLLETRKNTFSRRGERDSDKHIFSKLIICDHCGSTFRRIVRTYKNTYIRWVCNKRNSDGVDSCPNSTVVDEQEMLAILRDFYVDILFQDQKYLKKFVQVFCKYYKKEDQGLQSEREYKKLLNKLHRLKDKYILMYKEDVITLEELKEHTSQLQKDILCLNNELELLKKNTNKASLIETAAYNVFYNLPSMSWVEVLNNKAIKRIIRKITVSENGKVDIYLKRFSDSSMSTDVHLKDNLT